MFSNTGNEWHEHHREENCIDNGERSITLSFFLPTLLNLILLQNNPTVEIVVEDQTAEEILDPFETNEPTHTVAAKDLDDDDDYGGGYDAPLSPVIEQHQEQQQCQQQQQTTINTVIPTRSQPGGALAQSINAIEQLVAKREKPAMTLSQIMTFLSTHIASKKFTKMSQIMTVIKAKQQGANVENERTN
jgi:hypothetical protein